MPPVGASYHWMLLPSADKSEIVEGSQKVCSIFPVGDAGAVTFMVIYYLHVIPLVVTSTQYSVVSDGVTEMFSDISPVDHR